GANEFQIFSLIIFPLAKPAVTTVCIFTFVGTWTDFLAPRIFITQKTQYTLSLGLLDYFSVHQTEWTYLMAACVVFVLPVVILFFFAQRLFVEGISLTGIKG
ncbi:MAG: ABC transporter permease subunit, partial [Chloroflexota bacterium]